MELHERTIVISESRSIEEDSLASPFLPLHQHFAEIDATVTIKMSQCHSLLMPQSLSKCHSVTVC